MSPTLISFYCIAACILFTGILAVTTRKIFRAAIWLLFSLIGIAALYFLLQVEFIAAVQIVVYVGGIVVLIIFSIFLTQKSGDLMPKPALSKIILSAFAVLFGLGFVGNLIRQHDFVIPTQNNFNPAVNNIGTKMLSTTEGGFALPFELVSMLLLAAMIGCIVIAMKIKKEEA